MSKAEILEQLPQLSATERTEIWEQIWRLEEQSEVTDSEKLILEEAQLAYNADPHAGSSWEEVEKRLRGH
jgi:putative addiction module component (TIGR02574 family)